MAPLNEIDGVQLTNTIQSNVTKYLLSKTNIAPKKSTVWKTMSLIRLVQSGVFVQDVSGNLCEISNTTPLIEIVSTDQAVSWSLHRRDENETA